MCVCVFYCVIYCTESVRHYSFPAFLTIIELVPQAINDACCFFVAPQLLFMRQIASTSTLDPPSYILSQCYCCHKVRKSPSMHGNKEYAYSPDPSRASRKRRLKRGKGFFASLSKQRTELQQSLSLHAVPELPKYPPCHKVYVIQIQCAFGSLCSRLTELLQHVSEQIFLPIDAIG